MKSSLRQRSLRGASLLLAILCVVPAHARVHHSEAWARERFATAERMREALNGRPPAERTRHDYQRVINNYRSVYLGAPTSTKADPSVVAVAETLVEMGRRFDDDKILNEAISQYKFLRREYPGSKYRFDGLFTIGEIYKDDLDLPEAARVTFQEFLHRYPHNRLADDAKQAIAELDQDAEAERAASAKKEPQKGKASKTESLAKDASGQDSSSRAASAKDESVGDEAGRDESTKGELAKEESPPEPRSGSLPRVTGIRHWSTPDYTRVAIDVEGDVKFQSQRIADPDRIFFDLQNTKLASTLVGKSFDVDDGFLKKIRVAQFARGRTRVVLEVDNLSDYNAFLLPNPYRLIIDIHGKNARTTPPRDKGDDATTEAADGRDMPRTSSGPEADASQEAKPLARAQVGKAPVTSMDVSDDAKVTVSGNAGKKRASALVKKVVEADDDDTPTQVAKLEHPELKAGASMAAHPTSAKKPPPDDAVADDRADGTEPKLPASESVGKTHRRGKSSASHISAPSKSEVDDEDLDVHEAQPTARGDRSLIRALGLKIGKIVIDAGHGGHDTGTIGPNGLEEKDLVLEVARRLGKLLETRLGAEVVYTRRDDTFVPLETRTAIANQARADLFISIHANSSHDAAARGVETYYLNFTSSPDALEVAARENAVSEKSIYELQDLVKKIALKEKIEESREFAADVQQSLHSALAVKSPTIRDRGVKKAPFIVLIGANMPSILAEISFVSNPTDARRLETGEYRQRIADSLYRGIAKYVNGLSGVKVASKMDKAAGQ
ncbi:MAG: N-acetylmuramoyl-L-alanine amidase [Candidatus Sulfotelmatobacter sp.]